MSQLGNLQTLPEILGIFSLKKYTETCQHPPHYYFEDVSESLIISHVIFSNVWATMFDFLFSDVVTFKNY